MTCAPNATESLGSSSNSSGVATPILKHLGLLATLTALAAYATIQLASLGGAPIRSDGYSYYVYLPSWFLYHDPTLQSVADDAFDLIPIARETLQSVIEEKGLNIQLAEAPHREEPTAAVGDSEDELDLKIICQLKSEADARRGGEAGSGR